MKNSRKATLAVIGGLAGFLATTAYDVMSDTPVGDNTRKAGKVSEISTVEGTVLAFMNDASQIRKRQVRSRLGLARRTDTARSYL